MRVGNRKFTEVISGSESEANESRAMRHAEWVELCVMGLTPAGNALNGHAGCTTELFL
jgi:hypothetical protein